MWSLHWTENPEERDRNPSAPQNKYTGIVKWYHAALQKRCSEFESWYPCKKYDFVA